MNSSIKPTRRATRLLRFVRLALHILRGIAAGALVFPFLDRAGRSLYVRWWSAHVLTVLAVQIEVSGVLPVGGGTPLMIVANHVSWLDIFAINSVRAVRFVAKSEIERWPVLSWICRHGGTMFIDRARRHHIRHVNGQVVAALEQGDTFAVFPEGIITTGDMLLPFNSSLLQPALTCNAKLCPVAIRYTRADGTLCSEADYEGEKSLLASLLLMVTQPVIHARLHFLPPLDCAGMHRRELAHEAARLIANSLGVAVPDKRAEKPAGRIA